MNIAIRAAFMAAALLAVHAYLTGAGATISHHMLLNVVVTGLGIIMAATAAWHFVSALFANAMMAIRGTYR